MDLGLEGKRVLITGGTRGIGEAVMHGFLAEGANVAFCAREPEGVDAKVQELAELGYDVHGSVCDVSDKTSYLKWMDDAVAALGGIDVFVPNVSAGAGQGDAAWQKAFDVDLMATVKGCETALRYMGASGGGAIVVVSSISALEQMGGTAPYNTVKAGLIAYASQLGEVAAPYNVRVNCVSPGPIHVANGFWGGVQRSQPEAYMVTQSQQPFGRLGSAEEVARCIVFLASPAASWVTGTNMVVDGGFTKRIQY